MKTAVAGLAALAAGVALGVAAGWAELARWKDDFRCEASLGPPLPAQGAPKMVVEGGDTAELGVIVRHGTGEHTFTVRNEGEAPLDVELDEPSCGLCIDTDFKKARLAPGEATKITLRWTVSKDLPEFNEYAEFYTTDPQRPIVRLTLHGQVVRPLWAVPDDTVSFGEISSNEPATRRFKLFAFQTDRLEVVGHSLSDPETARFFEVSWEPLPPEEVAKEPHARSGVAIEVTIKPGMSFGAINQSLRLRTNLPENNTKEINLQGSVVSDITIVGPRMGQDNLRLNLGPVKQDQGAEARLHLVVKGPYRDNVTLRIEQTDPADVLHAELGPARALPGGAVVLYPLTIRIPPGARTVNRLSADQAHNGKVVIGTTHPQTKQVTLYVRFAVGE